MRISDHKINEIRSRANIVDVISSFIPLKRHGRNYMGLCPFHSEKTPSFVVSEQKQIFNCFGCHVGGDVFKFVKEYKSISFIEAVQEVAELVGITIEDTSSNELSRQEKEIEELYEINVVAARYFSNILLNETDGEIGRKYFKDRNIQLVMQKAFGLGFAPNKRDELYKFLLSQNINIEKAKLLGLIDVNDTGNYYDKLRGRVVYPIFSPNGRVIAFAGRVLGKVEGVAKYLNSPESPIYYKRRVLYGLSHSKDDIRKQDSVILVEGYMDLISLFQKGIKNVVASSGTALTEEQVTLLSRYTRNIFVVYDSDPAGEKAALRSIELLLKKDFEVKILNLPEGDDPDSFINKNSKADFEEQLNKTFNFLEYQADFYKKRGDFDDPNKETIAIKELVKSVSFINDEMKREVYIKHIAQKFNIRLKLLENELLALLHKVNSQAVREVGKPINTPIPKTENLHETPILKAPKSKVFTIEKTLIKLLFEGDEQIMGQIFDNILPADFTNSFFSKLSEIAFNAFKEDIYDPPTLLSLLPDKTMQDFIFELTLKEQAVSKKWEDRFSDEDPKKLRQKECEDTIRQFHIFQIEQQLKALKEQLILSENSDNVNEILELIKELSLEKANLFNISNS
ncbi:MAG TPA: DNA primase [Melioribacteraceae bacterium]|nr:DNA primase [Melioribacteraceae bacterium]